MTGRSIGWIASMPFMASFSMSFSVPLFRECLVDIAMRGDSSVRDANPLRYLEWFNASG